MNKVHILDCTLRDGGYCNQWKFGFDNISTISKCLIEADIDIIECGFITKVGKYSNDYTKYTQFSQLKHIIPNNRRGKLFVVMINYGEFPLEEIPECKDSWVDGIRVAFHKKDCIAAMEYCVQLKEKGYKVFVQAMVSLSYSDEEFLDLIHKANNLMPYAFYIVDSFGMMKGKDLIRLFFMIEHNLNENIWIGFHSHNNMQLSYSNAQTLVGLQTNRDLIIDASIYGMGRGAGNLNTELFVEYLNDTLDTTYNLKPLLSVIDEILSRFHEEKYWGYSLPNYLSAKYNTHPNYAKYLDEKKTLTVENMDDIFTMMDDDKRVSYDPVYIEALYERYMASGEVQEERLADFKSLIEGREILIIAPGRSSFDERDKIIELINKNRVVTMSINTEYVFYPVDYIFLSNLRRYRELDIKKHSKCIVTSNIPATDIYLKTSYADLTNEYEPVRDNAGLMAINLMKKLNARKIYIAGMDGYSIIPDENYIDNSMTFFSNKVLYESMNDGMSNVLTEYANETNLEFVTSQKYVRVK